MPSLQERRHLVSLRISEETLASRYQRRYQYRQSMHLCSDARW
jgi:hypothetical protein